MIGLSISVVGVDANSGVYRYTFDLVHLSDGIEFVVVVIALFAVSEMLEMLERSWPAIASRSSPAAASCST